MSLDATLLAAYCTALAALQDKPFALPVVCFTGSDAQRPAEFTELTWVRSPEPGTDPATLARAYCRQLAQDLERGGGAGLAEMRSLVVRRRRDADFAHPVVFTTVLDVGGRGPCPTTRSRTSWRSCRRFPATDNGKRTGTPCRGRCPTGRPSRRAVRVRRAGATGSRTAPRHRNRHPVPVRR
ncbi:hypothetical protein SVIOM342S_01742 [Streptomyces violaceorubidus]